MTTETTTKRRRTRSNGDGAGSANGLAALAALAALVWGAPSFDANVFAQRIINDSTRFNNAKFESFSTESPKKSEKVAWLDGGTLVSASDAVGSTSEANRVDETFAAPTDAPRNVASGSRRIPFRFPAQTDPNAATAIELLCSGDGGATWVSYSSVRVDDGRSAFLFEAPKAGVYWFVLKTYFKNGDVATSPTRAYRFARKAERFGGGTSVAPSAARSIRTVETTSAFDLEPAADGAAPGTAVGTALGTAVGTASETTSGGDSNGLALPELGGDSGTGDGPNDSGNDFSTDADSTGGDSFGLGGSDDEGLDDVSTAPTLPSPTSETKKVGNAASADSTPDASGASSASASSNGSEPEIVESNVAPHPGKIKAISTAKDKNTDELMIIVRWFRPEELSEEFRGKATTVKIERGDSLDGPWTTIVDNLKSEERGYYWYATPDDLKPFYLRTVATDVDGNAWIDAPYYPVDVSAQAVKSALGSTRTKPAAGGGSNGSNGSNGSGDESNDGETVSAKRPMSKNAASDDDAETSAPLIRNAAASDETSADEDAESNSAADASGDGDSGKSGGQKSAKVTTSRTTSTSKSAFSAPRPSVPAPTDPNQFELNPLFTKGFGVFLQATQARVGDGTDVGGKRSIFTPPRRTSTLAATTPPAEFRNYRAAAKAAAKEAAAKREESERRANDMSTYEKSPELMEGMVFYQDENGNLTRTPPKDFESANVVGSVDANGGQYSGQYGGQYSGPIAETQTLGASADGTPLVLPRDNVVYDSAPNSGAASLTNSMYPNAATPSSSPLDSLYSTGSNGGAYPNGTVYPNGGAYPNGTVYPNGGAYPNGTVYPNGTAIPTTGGYRTIPQTSFGSSVDATSTGVGPGYSAPGSVSTGSGFPPRPTVSR